MFIHFGVFWCIHFGVLNKTDNVNCEKQACKIKLHYLYRFTSLVFFYMLALNSPLRDGVNVSFTLTKFDDVTQRYIKVDIKS